MPIETIVSLPMAWVLGLVYGMGPCLVSCLPYLGPVFLARDSRDGMAWHLIVPVSAGRLTAYGGFGALAGFVGHYAHDGGAIPAELHLVIGAAALMVGLALFRRSPACCGAHPGMGTAPLRRMPTAPHPLLPGGLYLMGIGMALTPCAPLGVVLFSSAASGHALSGLALGLAFGTGAVLIPSLVYGLGVARFGTRLRRELGSWRKPLETLSASLLLLAGLGQFLLAF